jgi:hypothetical protein
VRDVLAGTELREAARFAMGLVDELARVDQKIGRLVEIGFPELEAAYDDPTCVSALAVLRAAPTAAAARDQGQRDARPGGAPGLDLSRRASVLRSPARTGSNPSVFAAAIAIESLEDFVGLPGCLGRPQLGPVDLLRAQDSALMAEPICSMTPGLYRLTEAWL